MEYKKIIHPKYKHMSVNSKHMATFLLGAAAAFGAYKYLNLSEEEKEKLARDVKEKANKLKRTALDAEDQAMDYFKELQTKGADALHEYLPKVEEFMDSLFKGGKKTAENSPAGNTPA